MYPSIIIFNKTRGLAIFWTDGGKVIGQGFPGGHDRWSLSSMCYYSAMYTRDYQPSFVALLVARVGRSVGGSVPLSPCCFGCSHKPLLAMARCFDHEHLSPLFDVKPWASAWLFGLLTAVTGSSFPAGRYSWCKLFPDKLPLCCARKRHPACQSSPGAQRPRRDYSNPKRVQFLLFLGATRNILVVYDTK